MASIYPRSNQWRVEVKRKNHSRLSRTFKRKADAEQWALETEASLLGSKGGVDRKRTVKAALERYVEEVTPKRKGARWEKLRISKFLRTLPFIHLKLDDVTPDAIGKWRDVSLRTLEPGSVRRDMGLLSAMFHVAQIEWRWCRGNPVKDAKLPPKPASRKRLVAPTEVDAITRTLGFTGGPPRTLSQEVALAFLLALETGMRASEITTLEWRQVYAKARYLTLEKTKNGDTRDVPLSTRAIELLKLAEGRDEKSVFTITAASRDALFRKARAKAKLEGFTFHDSRHTAVTTLAEKLDVLELARMIGHRDIKSLMIYFNKPASAMAMKLG